MTVMADREAVIRAAAMRIARGGDCAPRRARDPVNQAMVNNWLEAIGDSNPVYSDPGLAAASVHGGLVAPPAMIQVWTMRGMARPVGAQSDPLHAMTAILDDAGYTSVVATDCEQTYHRYLRMGEQAEVVTRLEDVTGPKRTALGEGWFVTTRSTWRVSGEVVAEMLFRVLKFRPPLGSGGGVAGSGGGSPPSGEVARPTVSRDTEFFWQGTAVSELRIQRCGECGRLRHPPGPACPDCGALRPGYVVSTGRGRIYSYVVHHHPPVPGKRPPYVVALVDLEEGVRMLGELVDAAPERAAIGLSVTATFVPAGDGVMVPAWRLEAS